MAADGKIVYKAEVDSGQAMTSMDKLKKMATGLGLAMVAAFAVKKVLEFGAAFETSFAKVKTLVDPAVTDIKALENGILELSRTAGRSAEELSEGLYQAISAGVEVTGDGAEAMAFMDRMNQLALGGFTDMTKAVDLTTTAMNIYGFGLEDVDYLTDLFIKTQNAGKTTVDELAASMANVLPTAGAMGVGIEEVMAAMAAMTAQGVPTAKATTQLQRLFAELGKEGTKASDALFEMSGKTFQQLQKEGKSVSDIMNMMQESADESGLSMLDLFGSIQAGQGALLLAGEGSEMFNDALDSMTDGIDATGAAYDIMADTFSHKSDVAKENVKALAIQAFAVLGKVMGGVIIVFSKIIDGVHWFLKNGGIFKYVVLGIVGALTAFKVVSIAITTATKLWAAAQWLLNIALTANPLGIIIVAIGAFVGAIVFLIKNLDGLRDKFFSVFRAIGNFYIGIVNLVIKGVNTMIKAQLFGINMLIKGLNKIPFVNIPQIGLSIPEIPMLAEGGIVDSPTLAMIGEGNEAEAVIPLSKLESMANIGGGSGKGTTANVNLNVDGETLARIVLEHFDDTLQMMQPNMGTG